MKASEKSRVSAVSRVVGAAALLFATGLVAASLAAVSPAAAAKASAKPAFNGMWSVVVVTEQGECDRAYRYPIVITSDGELVNAGSASFDISGKVSTDGKLLVRLSHGPMTATGTGRLKGAEGAGQWSAGVCAGSWTAERRG